VFLFFAVFSVSLAAPDTAWAAVVETDPEVQTVMGDLYTLALTMRLYHDETRKTQCPSLDQLERYFQQPLPAAWPDDYRTAVVDGMWWVGRKVPEFSRARKFLRENALSLGLYDKESGSSWLGGAFVWAEAVSFDGKDGPAAPAFQVMPEEGGRRLFVNPPGTEYYWWSDLLYVPAVHTAALKKFAASEKRTLIVPPAPTERPEVFTASPVSPPENFSVRDEEDEGGIGSIEMGVVILNPFPRPQP
jgi:hypothetical protein